MHVFDLFCHAGDHARLHICHGLRRGSALGEIGGAVLCNLIIFLLVYALTVLTTIVCGNTVITLLLLVWVFFSPR